MGGRATPARNGLEWWTKAWPLFTRQIGMWIGLIVVTFIVFAVVSLIPVIGQLAITLFWPAVAGGLMLGAREVDRDGVLGFGHLTAGFSKDAGQLILLGVAYLVGMVVAAGIAMLIAGVGMGTMLMGASGGGTPAAMGAVGAASVLLAVLIAVALLVPVYMATWFAPALIVFHGTGAVDAMKASFFGCLKNIVPFLVYGLVGLLLAIVASIPFGLGWLVLGPVLVISVYVGYRDIYLAR
ncbi:MAG: hypothetical protein A3G25_07165 [Betaproteobacteria bacterium RIFCSPLOWO2_12_FULL_63_13]|nr:MAG: hypothetical protein A3H32_17390 [Betaproteobacteria bacterium RIFCSPLOWO2_02_FULL_63_19]OGA54640.1 MAG: hypothetical protein A3G25_07165 [Betaproteobacteria bacterium RIFCSPLOWO2_12_FULL_63_13]